MSVLIKGMKMPKTCIMCWFSPICPVWVKAVSRHKGYDNRLPDCPLVEVLPHGRLIDADALIKTLNNEKIPYNADVNYFLSIAPTIIEAEEKKSERT